MRTRSSKHGSWMVLALVLSLTACSEKPTRDEGEPAPAPAAPETPTPNHPSAPAPGKAPAPSPETPGPEARPTPRPRPEARPAPRVADKYAEALLLHLRRRIQQEASLDEGIRKAIEQRAGKLRRMRKLVTGAYSRRGYEPFLSERGAIHEDGQLAVSLILDVEAHGLEPSPYPVKLLTAAKAELETAQATLDSARAEPGSAAVAKLIAVADGFEPLNGDSYSDQRDRVARALLDAGLDDEAPFDSQISELQGWWKSVHASRETITRSLAEMDVLVAQGFFQYALDFKHLKVAHPFDAMRREEIPRAPNSFRRQLARDVQQAGGKLGATMRSWWPRHPYYLKTKAALETYRRLADEKLVPDFKMRGRLKKGMKGKKVIALKERLAAEHYFEGDLQSDVFDADLEEAVKRYQKHHQLDEDGIVRNKYGLAGLTRTSLAVGMDKRVEQLKLAMQRWRESPSHNPDEPFYFRVNVPQFEVEVWDGDKLARKHRIIVGNNKFESDPDHGREGHLNRTALISDAIERVVINPVWRVPERIKIQEIMVEAQEDPDYMKKHNYKTRVLADGSEQVYQEAGPGNALGRVKLLFPNRHAIYMHDTPKRRLFSRTIRTFSHGCMRLQDPVDMATFLLERDGSMTAAEVQQVLKTGKERGVRLKNKVPIHIEYNTIAFEPGSDLPIFLNDVYKYDRAYYEGDVPMKAFKKIPIVKTEFPDDEEVDPRAEDGEDTNDGAATPDTEAGTKKPAVKPGTRPAGDKAPGKRPGLKPLKKPTIDNPFGV